MFGNAEVAAIAVALAAAVLAATDQRLLRGLRTRGADSPETAHLLNNFRGLERWRLSRLCQKGMVQRAGENAYFIDEAVFVAARAARRKRAIVVLGVLPAAAVLYVAVRYVAS